MHLGEGATINGKINQLEYFEDDDTFYNSIMAIIEKYRGRDARLIFNGDTFDFLSVTRNNKTLSEPHEEAALEKIEKICKAHPKFFEALRIFVLSGGKIKFIIGNHDMHLFWSPVVLFICKQIIPPRPEPGLPELSTLSDRFNTDKIITFDREYFKDGALFIHGNNGDLINITPEGKKIFLYSRRLKSKYTPILNMPFGSYMAEISYALAKDGWFIKGSKWIGRMEGHKYVYLDSILRPSRWLFAIKALLIVLLAPLKFRLSRRWWVRKNAGLWMLIKYAFRALISTMYNESDMHQKYAKKLLEKEGVKTVFIGHHHQYKVITLPQGKIIYSGNWAAIYEPTYPELQTNWKRLRFLERAINCVKSLYLIYGKKTRHLFQPKKTNLFNFGVCEYDVNGGHKSYVIYYDTEDKTIKTRP